MSETTSPPTYDQVDRKALRRFWDTINGPYDDPDPVRKSLDETPILVNVYLPLAGHDYRTPLFHACLHGKKRIVDLLLERKSQHVIWKCQGGMTPLQVACEKGRSDIATALLRSIPDPAKRKEYVDEKDPGGRTALHYASMRSLDTVRNLLEFFKANLYLTDNKGSTCLHVAAMRGETEIISHFLSIMDQKTIVMEDSEGNTAWDYACGSFLPERGPAILRNPIVKIFLELELPKFTSYIGPFENAYGGVSLGPIKLERIKSVG